MILPIQSKELSADGFCWNQLSPRIGTIDNSQRYFAPVTYFAFDSWDDAHDFFKAITDKRLCGRAQVRKSERFATSSHEVKVWSLRQNVLEQLIRRDRNRKLPLPPLRREWESIRSFDAIQCEAA